MDFNGQDNAYKVISGIMWGSGVVGFSAGFIMQQFLITFITIAIGSFLALVLAVPSWPMYRRNPIRWSIPIEEKEKEMQSVVPSSPAGATGKGKSASSSAKMKQQAGKGKPSNNADGATPLAASRYKEEIKSERSRSLSDVVTSEEEIDNDEDDGEDSSHPGGERANREDGATTTAAGKKAR